MRLAELTVIDVPNDADVLPILSNHLVAVRPTLILTGTSSERGESSGFVPYAIAEKIRASLVPDVVDMPFQAGCMEVVQALPRGRR
jgi:electron transfer flavoprotein beta subunit